MPAWAPSAGSSAETSTPRWTILSSRRKHQCVICSRPALPGAGKIPKLPTGSLCRGKANIHRPLSTTFSTKAGSFARAAYLTLRRRQAITTQSSPRSTWLRRDKLVQKFAGIQNPTGIKKLLQIAVKLTRNIRGGLRPPAFFGQANSMFARDDTTPGQHLGEQFVQGAFDPRTNSRRFVVCGHDVDVNIAIARMTEAGDREPVLTLQGSGEVDKIDNPAARDDHILVQFR